MNIEQLCIDLNTKATSYRIGRLQEIRKKLKDLSKKPTSDIFNNSTIDNDWAFHVGGRTELQFNIGNENEGLRYGFAFSLEPSQTLPDPKILYPKILKLNSIIVSSPAVFSKYKMLIWDKNGRSNIENVVAIPEKAIENNSFIFIGKIKRKPTINEILETFDDLLDVYIDVENEKYIPIHNYSNSRNGPFSFSPTTYNLVINKKINSITKNTNVEVRHTLIQMELEKILINKYGKNNVAVEHPIEGNRVDIVVNDEEKIYFYEVKIGQSSRSCIRQALGQLFEYSYFPDKNIASKLIVVGEPPLDIETEEYITHLNSKFTIPIEYVHITI